ncbi:MAG: hypothetical protein KKC84_03330 [Candidatus Omnitrophica bacterium]|nr:hypothetical protein [Candidatus Omnitrophota bacterium]
MRRIACCFLFLIGWVSLSFAAPCYGTRLPEKNKFVAGTQTYSILSRYLEQEKGKIRSTQHFVLVSYGVFDWFAIDLKGGAGNIKQHPAGSDEVDYASNFAGGYGYRIQLYDRQPLKMVFGFQHISVHPQSTHLGDDKHRAILDDWQYSLLASYDTGMCTPYLGTRWSRVDYIHWTLDKRKRVMSDLTKSIGLVAGIDILCGNKLWINFEGQFIDSESVALSLNYSF